MRLILSRGGGSRSISHRWLLIKKLIRIYEFSSTSCCWLRVLFLLTHATENAFMRSRRHGFRCCRLLLRGRGRRSNCLRSRLGSRGLLLSMRRMRWLRGRRLRLCMNRRCRLRSRVLLLSRNCWRRPMGRYRSRLRYRRLLLRSCRMHRLRSCFSNKRIAAIRAEFNSRLYRQST